VKIRPSSMSDDLQNQSVAPVPGSGTSLERALPRVEAALRAAGVPDAERKEWMLRLRSMLDISEDEMIALVEESNIAPATSSYLTRQFNIWRHELARWWNHRNPIVRLIYGVSWLSVLVGAAAKSGLSFFGYAMAGLILLIKVWNAIKEFDPKHLPMLKRTRTERQLLLEKLIHSVHLWVSKAPAKREIEVFQQDTLHLIASYVRDHRSDLKGKKIFVNLLIRDGEELVVVARSDLKRPIPQRYKADECLVMWTAIETGVTQFTGDVYIDSPATPAGKPYNSVLAMPIKLDKKVVGGVSVDSAAKYHFDRYVDELQTELAPYVQLLAVTLAGHYGTHERVAQLPLRIDGEIHNDGYSDDP
jgi:hypothetical protein